MDLLWLGEPDCSVVARAGGKAASLSRLAARYPVPPGFCLAADAFSRRCASHAELLQVVEAGYQSLTARCGVVELAVAVRSSSIDEDGTHTSFAGQYESFLNVVGTSEIVRAVYGCRTSARSERAVAYRRFRGEHDDAANVAVLVQQLIRAEASAVVFSVNPVTGNRDEIIIDANWGLGESLVGGTVTPDSYVVRKHDLTLVFRSVRSKSVMTVPVPGGAREVHTPRFLQSASALNDAQVAAVARLARDLERDVSRPVDVECAFQDGRLYLLQCRPITTLPIPTSLVAAPEATVLTGERAKGAGDPRGVAAKAD